MVLPPRGVVDQPPVPQPPQLPRVDGSMLLPRAVHVQPGNAASGADTAYTAKNLMEHAEVTGAA